MKILGIIPARYASTRFPGKPLARLGDKTVIEHVYRRVATVLSDVVVATDDQRIYDAVQSFGGQVVMTSASHTSGTDRCYEALQRFGSDYDVVVNIQGDEPFIAVEQVAAVCQCFEDTAVDIATLVMPFGAESTYEMLSNPNTPKVVLNKAGYAQYFSRSVIPYLRGIPTSDWAKQHTYYKHIGLYAFRANVLAEITQLPVSLVEQAESLEQLRWLESGYRIRVAHTDQHTIGIDTPEDLAEANRILEENKNSI